MPSFNGRCHCGQVTWTAEIPEATHILCHCGACKVLGGGEYTLNQIIPKENLKITKGELGKYTYKGDSAVLGPDKIVIRTSLLAGSEKWGKPAAEIYGKEKLSWQPQTATDIFEVTPPS
ncbi:hypothetical protein UCRPC4_g05246 [Phaeomoniella chlamydospora]|uniref:CENP-V/GFA domain-containing protein n=1 Tax=Phaeomoniella chlamydospora TaxID=158046 RepID=A0A0G2G2C5_PHACM|nr:hypothetical protein UCRPC4_g05246 [Phaeomoniella chlamydospora]